MAKAKKLQLVKLDYSTVNVRKYEEMAEAKGLEKACCKYHAAMKMAGVNESEDVTPQFLCKFKGKLWVSNIQHVGLHNVNEGHLIEEKCPKDGILYVQPSVRGWPIVMLDELDEIYYIKNGDFGL